MTWRGFGSDNHSGTHPAVLNALVEASDGHAHAYGDDEWTRRAVAVLRGHLGDDCDVTFVFNGTGANCVSLATVCRPWESVICPASSHINTDEAAAPERLAGVKLVPIDTPDGKLTPALVRPYLATLGFEHAAQPKVISVSNVSELGTVYTPAELSALAAIAHDNGMLLHVDGARIANACAALGCGLRDVTSDAGVDVLSLGATKNGLAFGEAVVLFGGCRTHDVVFVRKQLGQLASKMRFVSAQFEALFSGDLWIESARHANVQAARLADGLASAGVRLSRLPQANEVFGRLPKAVAEPLQERFHFYEWAASLDGEDPEYRWVTSWDTDAADVDALVDEVARSLRA